MNFHDNLSAMPDISHLSGLDVLDAQGKVLHHIPAVQGNWVRSSSYNALDAGNSATASTSAAERGLSLFAEHNRRCAGQSG